MALTSYSTTKAASGNNSMNFLREGASESFKWMLQNTYFDKRFVGTEPNSLIQLKQDLKKQAGETVRFFLDAPLQNAGRVDDARMKDHEEKMDEYAFDVTIHQLRNAVKSGGLMSDKRVRRNIIKRARPQLGSWLAQTEDTETILALSGLASRATGLFSANAPSTNRFIFDGVDSTAHTTLGGGTTDAALDDDPDTGEMFGTKMISILKRKAIASSSSYPRLRPLGAEGRGQFALFLHPLQVKELWMETAWINAQKDAQVRGKDNPLFTGALGMYDDVLIYECPKIETRLGAGGTTASEYFDVTTDAAASGVMIARALFCGAQAAVHAYGKDPFWKVESDDYDNIEGISQGVIWSPAKTEFNSEDFGVIVLDTAVIPD